MGLAQVILFIVNLFSATSSGAFLDLLFSGPFFVRKFDELLGKLRQFRETPIIFHQNRSEKTTNLTTMANIFGFLAKFWMDSNLSFRGFLSKEKERCRIV